MTGFRPRFFLPPDARPAQGGRAAQGGPAAQGARAAQGGPAGQGSGASAADDLTGSEWELGAEDSHHALRALRLAEGGECEVVAGAAVYAATVTVARSPVRVRLTARLEGPAAGARYRVQVGVAQALTRPALVDHVLEKATEVGASFFVLVHTDGSPRWTGRSADDRLARWRRIILEAAKQSKQVAVPDLQVAGSIAEALDTLRGSGTLSLVLDPAAPAGIVERLDPVYSLGGRIALWVGPESGWTSADAEALAGSGAEAVRLGQSILRTETAGPVAVAVTRLLLRDW